MSRHELGVDLIDIDRIGATLERFPERFRSRVLTDREDRYCGTRIERVAGRWAATPRVTARIAGDGARDPPTSCEHEESRAS